MQIFRRLFPLTIIILAGVYLYARQSQANSRAILSLDPTTIPDILINSGKGLGSVLSSMSKRVSTTTQTVIEKVTDEQEEALINKTVENITKQVKDLPQEQVKKIKYEFCKDVVTEYEDNNTPSN